MPNSALLHHEVKYDDIKNRTVFILSLFRGIIKVEKLFFTFLKRDQLLMPQRSGEVKENKNSFRLSFLPQFGFSVLNTGNLEVFLYIIKKYWRNTLQKKCQEKLTTGGMRYKKCTTPSNF